VIAAYILIQTGPGKAATVAAALRNLPGVMEAVSLAGPYDVIARPHAREIDELAKLVTSRVQALDGVRRTMTCPVVHLLGTGRRGPPHHHPRAGRGRRPGRLHMRLAQPGVRHRQDGRHDGPTAAGGRCRRSARVGDVPAISSPRARPLGGTEPAGLDRQRLIGPQPASAQIGTARLAQVEAVTKRELEPGLCGPCLAGAQVLRPPRGHLRPARR